MTVIAYVFPKLQTAKELVRPMSKKRRFRTPLGSQDVKYCQSFVKSARQHFYHIFPSHFEKFSWKISLLVICDILR